MVVFGVAGGAGIGHSGMKQGFNSVIDAALQVETGFRIELAAQMPHAGITIKPVTQSGVGSLTDQAFLTATGIEAGHFTS